MFRTMFDRPVVTLPTCMGALCMMNSASAQVVDTPYLLEDRPPHVIPLKPATETSPAARVMFGGLASVQANVSAQGNIIGDAANEPSLTVDPTAPNRIAVGWRQFDSQASSFRQAGYSYSRDGGRTWAPKNVIDPGFFRTDPVLRSTADGRFYYLSLEVTISGQFFCCTYESEDGGATWPIERFAYGGDKQWLAIDQNGPAAGNLYQCWNTAGNEFFPDQFNRFIAGATEWEAPVEYDPFNLPPARPVFGQNAVGPDGTVYVAGSMNSANTDTFWVVRSSNAQDPNAEPTFNIAPIDLGGNLRIGTGPNPSGLLGQVNIAVDHSAGPTLGYVYVLGSVDPPGSDPMDIHFIRSADGGVNWSQPVRINDDPGDDWQWFGTMGVAPNGRIDVVWNDHRLNAQTNVAQLYYSSSTDGGLTWSDNQPLSPQFDSFLGWPSQAKLGDYYDIISDDVGAHVSYAATFNGEQDVYYLRIGDYDCNGNSIGDADDLIAGTSEDCNDNEIPDECEIAAGTEDDADENGVPDSCEVCAADLDNTGDVGTTDLLLLLAGWGGNGPGADLAIPADSIDINDLLALLAAWGPCD